MRVMALMCLQNLTTDEILCELDHRNEASEAHRNKKEQTAEHLRKIRLAFSLRPGGLEATRMDA